MPFLRSGRHPQGGAILFKKFLSLDKIKSRIIFLCSIAIIAYIFIFDIFMGQDLNFDQLNYHFYSSYMFISGSDIADSVLAQRQSWFNPTPNVPTYLAVTRLPAWAMEALLIFISVPAPLTSTLFVRELLKHEKSDRDWYIIPLCVFVGLTSFVSTLVLATTYNEAWLPALSIGAFTLIMRALRDSQDRARRLAVAGVLLGSAVGLKVTNAPFAVGAFAGLSVVWMSGVIDRKCIGTFVLGGFVGFLLCGGWWLIATWHRFGDPFYPLLSVALHSPWAIEIAEEQFRPTHVWQLLTDPASLASGFHKGVISTQIPARDARPLLLLISLVVLTARYGLLRARGESVEPAVAFAVVATLLAYLSWFFVFDIERYMQHGYLVAAGFAVLAFRQMRGRLAMKAADAVIILLLVAVLVGSRPVRSGRGPHGGDWFDLRVPDGFAQPDTLYVLAGSAPMSWLELERGKFGPGAKFVLISGNFNIERLLPPESALGKRIARIVTSHQGPIRSIEMVDGEWRLPGGFALYRLAKSGPCVILNSKPMALRSCPLERITTQEGEH